MIEVESKKYDCLLQYCKKAQRNKRNMTEFWLVAKRNKRKKTDRNSISSTYLHVISAIVERMSVQQCTQSREEKGREERPCPREERLQCPYPPTRRRTMNGMNWVLMYVCTYVCMSCILFTVVFALFVD